MHTAGEISRKQETAITALLTCPSILEAAQQSAVAEVTLHRWLKEPAFQTAYKAARRAVVDHAMTQIQRATEEAVQTLRRVMKGANPASAKVAAARAILDLAFRSVEFEAFDARLAALEAARSSDDS